MDTAISVKRGSSSSQNTSQNISMTLSWMKFHLLLLEVNRDFDALVDISASQTDISPNC